MIELIQRGGWVMYPLLALSLVTVAVVVERVLFWLNERQLPARAALESTLHALDLDRGDPDALEAAIGSELGRLERGMPLIDTAITAAPLMGILGTVLGIIESFELLSATAIVDPLSISGGVAKALITTATGLIIALVALFPFNYFRARVDRRMDELEREARRLIATAY